MKTAFRFLSFIAAAVLVLSGCSTAPGAPTLPEASTGFVARQKYLVSSEKLWDAALVALEKNRIGVTSSDKASGTLQTDYLEAPSKLVGLGILAAHHFRYKYNVSVRSQPDGSTRLTVLARVESYMSSGDGSTQWSDVSSANSSLLKNLESWLYEKIEEELPKP
jgi:uncharacterized lipoprotein